MVAVFCLCAACGAGAVANRVLTVGDPARAKRISKQLDGDDEFWYHESWRGFPTYTGRYNGVPVTIMASGMGYPNVDFVVRECRAVTTGPLAIIRFGSSGGMRDTKPGAMCVATDGCVSLIRNPDAFFPDADPSEKTYKITRAIPGDDELTDILKNRVLEHVAREDTAFGVNCSGCSFYSSQGRIDAAFDDRNATLLDELEKQHPTAVCMEMETSHLFDLARCSNGTIRAAGLAMTLANRKGGDVVEHDRVAELEEIGGRAALEALATLKLEDEMTGPDCVWEHDTAE